MSIRVCSFILISGLVCASCGNNPSQPVGPSAPTNAGSAVVGNQAQPGAAAAQAASSGASQHQVTLSDACDPETFNAALGDGTCTRSGGVQFPKFLEELGRHGSVGAWHFAPSNVTMQVGQLLVAVNHGGETHTFTEVEEFGGGIVPQLNELMGLTEVAPECGQLKGGDFLAPGASSREREEDEGVEKYQCCIHPWMRAEVRVKEK